MKTFILLFLIYGVLSEAVEDEALREFAQGNRKFSAAVYKEIIGTGKASFIASPLSVETILAFTNEGAKGETAEELVSSLSLPVSKENRQKAFKSLLQGLKRSERDLKLLSANKVYVAEGVELQNSFTSIGTDVYGSGVENVNFEEREKTASIINRWVEANTNNKIKNLIDPQSLNQFTKLILVNALYFNGQWISEFPAALTHKGKFYVDKDRAIDIDTMQQVHNFNYHENPELNAKFLALPYKGGDVHMVIVLPNEVDGLSRLEQNMEQVFASQPFVREKVRVELPKFTIESEIGFVPILKNLGVNKIFSERADLSGISSDPAHTLSVTDVRQKAFINVTETGTEAAAATEVGLPLVSVPIAQIPPILFRADHPFLYYIRDNRSGVILFLGRYVK